jgi:hypothetical protein
MQSLLWSEIIKKRYYIMRHRAKHTIRNKSAKNTASGKKKKVLFIVLPAVCALALIIAFTMFNFQFIYGLIVEPVSRIFVSSSQKDNPQNTLDTVEENSDAYTGENTEESIPNEGMPEHKHLSEETPQKPAETTEEKETINEIGGDKPGQEQIEKKVLNTSPTIELEVYEGPLYSEAGDVCYYRVKAVVTGNPQPEVNFSKDDSLGWLGPLRAQVNLKRNEGSYTLTATAENNLGKASDNLTLSWGCNRSPDIRSINISPGTVYTGGQYEIFADVLDLDGDSIAYSWSATGGALSNSGSNPAIWNAPGTPGDYSITLAASDDKGNKSEPKTLKVTVKIKSEPVTSNTSVAGYIEVSQEQLVSLFTKRNSSKTERAARLAPLYIQYGKMFNIRADIAWAQMCHETGFLEFTGDVKPHQNNFGGIGATGGGVPGNSFASEELGVIAQYAHLAWYYFPTHVNQYCTIEYDPRHFENAHIHYTGDTRLSFLNGRWAPGARYTDKIALFASEVFGY